ncbi:tetratricopeptide repeat protein [Cohnella caldifontis]|uniref:tetratricopeptide repeat protein n=1 Tax=Cohnella caldifontis TaxID=3027471 RepID=UPI0023EB015D|nr:tetratricopeptide repeat protein [Cohnella sp. YIM B05605]
MTDKDRSNLENKDGMDGETCLRQAYDAIFHGDFESAAAWFDRAIGLEPDNASYYYKASITLARSGKTAAAERYARKAAELDPEDPVYAMNVDALEAKRLVSEARGLLELPVPEPDLAARLLREAESLDPLSAEAKLLLGMANHMQGDLRSAIANLREALNLEPQHEEAGRLLREWRKERRRLVQSQLSSPKPYRKR